MIEAPLWVRVSEKYRIADDCVAIELVPLEGTTLPAFSAGAFIDVDPGLGIVRPYSLANDPAETHRYLLGVLKVPGSQGLSAILHDVIQPWNRLQISAPRNLFPLDETAGHTLLLGGGIGVTPMLAFAHRLLHLNQSFALHLCARSRSRAPFAEQLPQLPFASQVSLHLDDDPASHLDLAAILATAPADTHLYLCGPNGFMEAQAAIASQFLPATQIHREHFDAPAHTPAPAPAAAAATKAATAVAPNRPFTVEIRSTGQVLQVPAERSLVDILQAAGLPVRRNCPRGFCGGCAVSVLEGQVEHRDRTLPDALRQAGRMLSCVSRARDEHLVLDL